MRLPAARRGFTIVEVLIVASLFTIIGVVVASLFTRGASTYRHGETHIEMQRSGRTVVSRLTPFLSSIFNAANPTATALIVPASADPNPNPVPNLVRFRTTEDWLNPAYPSQTTSSRMALSTADLRNYTYQIIQDANSGDVLLQKLEEPTPGTFNVLETRRLVRQKKSEEITNLRFTLARSNLLVMEFETVKETRGDGNQPMTVTEEFRVTYNLPTKTV